MAVIRKGATFWDIFKAEINVSVEMRNEWVVLDINNGVALIILGRAGFGGGKSRHKKSKGRKSKKRRSRKRGRRKTGRRKQTGGNLLKKMIFAYVFYYFMFSYFVTLQFSQSKHNIFASVGDWKAGNPMGYGAVHKILADRDAVDVTVSNRTDLTSDKIIRLMTSDGQIHDPGLSLNNRALRNYRPTFLEVDFAEKGSESYTQTLARLATAMPFVRRRPVVQMTALGDTPTRVGYTVHANWRRKGTKVTSMVLFNVTEGEGEHPTGVFRNTPDDPMFNRVAIGALREQVSAMAAVGMLAPDENEGIAILGMEQLGKRESSRLVTAKYLWHQEAAPGYMRPDPDDPGAMSSWTEHFAEGSTATPFRNAQTQMGRTDIHASIFTITYSEGHAQSGLRYGTTNDGEQQFQDVPTEREGVVTKILDQSTGDIYHGSVIEPIWGAGEERNMVSVMVLPRGVANTRLQPAHGVEITRKEGQDEEEED